MSQTQKQEPTQIIKHEKQGLEVLGDTDEMKTRLDLNSERLNLVHDFIAVNFTKGIDFGSADGDRNPKPTLLKPGAEKVVKLFNTRPTWKMDRDTWEMAGKPEGTVCYLCQIVDNTTGEVIGEGRGAESVGNKKRDLNKAIKIAEKCALIDAALYTFGLSEKFTQDMATTKIKLEEEKQALKSEVEALRVGCNSSLGINKFMYIVCENYLQEPNMRTIGSVRAMRKAIIEDRIYDLDTAQRIPE